MYDLLRDQPEDDASTIDKRVRTEADVESILEDLKLALQSIRSEIGLTTGALPEPQRFSKENCMRGIESGVKTHSYISVEA